MAIGSNKIVKLKQKKRKETYNKVYAILPLYLSKETLNQLNCLFSYF